MQLDDERIERKRVERRSRSYIERQRVVVVVTQLHIGNRVIIHTFNYDGDE